MVEEAKQKKDTTAIIELFPKKFYQEPEMTEWVVGTVAKSATSGLVDALSRYLPLSGMQSAHLKRVSRPRANPDSLHVLLMPQAMVPDSIIGVVG